MDSPSRAPPMQRESPWKNGKTFVQQDYIAMIQIWTKSTTLDMNYHGNMHRASQQLCTLRHWGPLRTHNVTTCYHKQTELKPHPYHIRACVQEASIKDRNKLLNPAVYVRCNYLPLPLIPASGTQVNIWHILWVIRCCYDVMSSGRVRYIRAILVQYTMPRDMTSWVSSYNIPSYIHGSPCTSVTGRYISHTQRFKSTCSMLIRQNHII